METINTLCGQTTGLLTVTANGTDNYSRELKQLAAIKIKKLLC
jgi:hypothetical protein